MSSEFNAYSSWLGIPEDEQPPHYYRLLGLEPFENDPDAIRQAGKRLLGMVKAKERGPNGTAARRLRAEVTFAASCLLDAKKKAKYDAELDAWFNEYEEEAGYESDEYELEEPNLPMAKIVPSGSGKTATKSRGGSSKSKSGTRSKSGSSKGKTGSSKGTKNKSKAASAGLMANPKILVAIVLLVVGVLGLSGGLAFVFLRSDPPVAVKDDKANTDAAALPDEEEEEEASTTKKSDEEEDEEEDATKTDESADEKKEEEKTPEGEAEKTADGEDKTGAAADTETKEDPEAKAPANADPMTPVAGETPAKPEDKTDPKKTDPKADPKKEEPKAEEPPKEEEKEPFQDLEDALELPVFVDAQTSTTPVVLAKVYPKEGDRVNTILSGGEAVLGKLGSFSLKGGLLTDPEPKWTVNFEDTAGAKTPVAQMAYKDNELTFAWTGQGDAAINNLLRNCMLKITAGYGNRNRPLRKPVIIEPLSVVMDKEGTAIDLPVVGMPEDEETVTLKFTKLLGGFPSEPTYDPPGGTLKPGESVDIMFDKVDLAFKAKFVHERDGTMKLDFRPMIRGERKGRGPRPLKPYVLPKTFDEMINFHQGELNQWTTNFDAFKKNPRNKEQIPQAEIKFQEASRLKNDLIKALTDLKGNVESLAKDGKVQFTIGMRVGSEEAVDPNSYTLELLKTKDYTPVEPDPKAAAGKKPAAKKK